jgi:hypothetical protein
VYPLAVLTTDIASVYVWGDCGVMWQEDYVLQKLSIQVFVQHLDVNSLDAEMLCQYTGDARQGGEY